MANRNSTPRVAIYARVSNTDQSTDSQLGGRCRKYAAGDILDEFKEKFARITKFNKRWNQLEVQASPSDWERLAESLEPVLEKVVSGWQEKEKEEHQSPPDIEEEPTEVPTLSH